MSTAELECLPHQVRFMMDTHRYTALVGGFGCGKSYGVGLKSYALGVLNQGFDGMIVSRTGEQLKKLMQEVFKAWRSCGQTYDDRDIKKFQRDAQPRSFTKYGDRQVIVKWAEGVYSNIYLGTTENYAYEKWAGGNLAWVIIDELDTMPHAPEVWSFANDRIRVGPFNQLAGATTPEGFGLTWDFFDNQPKKNPNLLDRCLIKGCTLDNPYINFDYVLNQIRTRDPASMRAYIYGDFVNLDGHLVYWAFDKDKNTTARTMETFRPDAVAHISIDWNKNINATTIWFVEQQKAYAVREIIGSVNARALITSLKFVLKGRPALFYPDASGFEGVSQLEEAFGEDSVLYHAANPPIKQTVAATNQRLCDADGIRWTFINPETCPDLFNGFLRQTLDAKGDPDKTKGLDHSLDGSRYFHHWNWAIDGYEGMASVIKQPDRPKYNIHQIAGMRQ